ncbi:MAG: single-stranded DNA-binding protein [Promethearchaeia archaeon]
MKVKDVEPQSGIPELTVRVVSVAPARIIRTRSGRKTQLTEVLVGDETGTVVFTLWGFGEGSDIKAGQVLQISDGWAKQYKGKIQISLGRSGSYEVIESAAGLPELSEILDTTRNSED